MLKVPRTPRSKGCRQCVERHVKCDERPPICRQCVRFGLFCSGPIQGPIFLDMSPAVARPAGPRKKGRKTSDNIKGDRSDSSTPSRASTSVAAAHDDFKGNTNTPPNISQQYLYPAKSTSSPSSAILHTPVGSSNFLEQTFVEKFVELSTSSRLQTNPNRPKSWMFNLPRMLSDPETPSLRYGIVAASLLYFAMVQRDKGAEIEAVRWYLAALESHRASIQNQNQRSSSGTEGKGGLVRTGRTSRIQDLCAPMLFLYFEMMRPTTSDAAAHHINAAVKVVDTLGPACFRAGLAHVLFRSIRHYAVFKSILYNEPCCLALPEWCEIPFMDNPKISYDLLIDIMLSIPYHLKLASVPCGGDLRGAVLNIPNLSFADRQVLERETLCVLDQLHNWWWHFKEVTGVFHADATDHADKTTTAVLSDQLEEHTIPSSIPLPYLMYPDTLTAKSVSLYNSSIVILHSVLLSLEEPEPELHKPSTFPIPISHMSSPQRHRSIINRHAASVLSVARYQNWRSPYCGDTMRTVFPLQIVAWLANDEAQRREAHETIARWGLEGR